VVVTRTQYDTPLEAFVRDVSKIASLLLGGMVWASCGSRNF